MRKCIAMSVDFKYFFVDRDCVECHMDILPTSFGVWLKTFVPTLFPARTGILWQQDKKKKIAGATQA